MQNGFWYFLLPSLSGSLTGNSGSMFPSINTSTPTTNLQVHNAFYATGATNPVGTIQTATTGAGGGVPLKLAVSGGDPTTFATTGTSGQSFYFAPLSTSVAVSLSTATTASGVVTQPIKFQTTAHAEVSQVG